jgi:hypothetical protein
MLVRRSEIEHQGPLPRQAQQVNPDKVMEHPACRGVLDSLACLVRERGIMRVEGLTKAVLSGRIDEQADRHHHQQGHEPFGCFERPRGGEKRRGFQQSDAPFCLGLPWVAIEHRLGRQCRCIPFMGGQDATLGLVDKGLTGREGGGQSPCERVDHLGRLGL